MDGVGNSQNGTSGSTSKNPQVSQGSKRLQQTQAQVDEVCQIIIYILLHVIKAYFN